jgi:hypothetical protein
MRSTAHVRNTAAASAFGNVLWGSNQRAAGEATVKSMWITVGVGTAVAVIGVILWFASDERLGLMLILGGMVVACLGIVMRLVTAYMDERAKAK